MLCNRAALGLAAGVKKASMTAKIMTTATRELSMPTVAAKASTTGSKAIAVAALLQKLVKITAHSTIMTTKKTAEACPNTGSNKIFKKLTNPTES